MIPRDVIETIALVALFVISSGLCALVGYALGRMRGEDPPERNREIRRRAMQQQGRFYETQAAFVEALDRELKEGTP